MIVLKGRDDCMDIEKSQGNLEVVFEDMGCCTYVNRVLRKRLDLNVEILT